MSRISGTPKRCWLVVPHYSGVKCAAFFSKKRALQYAVRREQLTGRRPWVLKYRFDAEVLRPEKSPALPDTPRRVGERLGEAAA